MDRCTGIVVGLPGAGSGVGERLFLEDRVGALVAVIMPPDSEIHSVIIEQSLHRVTEFNLAAVR